MVIMIVIENYIISFIFSLYKDMLNFWVYVIICLLSMLGLYFLKKQKA